MANDKKKKKKIYSQKYSNSFGREAAVEAFVCNTRDNQLLPQGFQGY